MKRRHVIFGAVLGALAAAPLAVRAWAMQDQAEKPPAPADMAAMMEQARKFTQPGEHHKILERWIGKWSTETRFFMSGQATPVEKGTIETKWLMPGRWLMSETKGTMMGMPSHSVIMMGYDNFKMSYVFTAVSNMDTAMLRAEGDMDPSGKTLIMYGTLDEYLTGEHDKMVKYLWRFESDDKTIMEIHDLPIGENNTKVIEIVATRVK